MDFFDGFTISFPFHFRDVQPNIGLLWWRRYMNFWDIVISIGAAAKLLATIISVIRGIGEAKGAVGDVKTAAIAIAAMSIISGAKDDGS